MADGYSELTLEKLKNEYGVNELNRMIRFLFENISSDGNMVKVYQGYGSPLNVVAAGVGSLYMRLDGGANTTLYVKESASDGTGWVAK